MRKAKSKRVRPPARVIRQLEAFYGTSHSVLTGEASRITWHHLDDNPSYSVFENLVPLRLDENANLEQAPDIFSFEDWRKAVRQHESRSRYPLAYGAARTGTFVLTKIDQLSDALELAADAIRCLRPIARLDLVADLLDRNVNPLLRDSRTRPRLAPLACARLCDELASVFREHGADGSWNPWFDLTLAFLERLNEWDHVATLRTQLFRHWSFLHLERGDLVAARAWMEHARQTGVRDLSWPALGKRVSQDLWAVRVALRARDFDQALGRVRQLEREGRIRPSDQLVIPGLSYPQGLDLWLESALQAMRAEAENGLGRTGDAREMVEMLRPIYTGSRAIVPTVGGAYPIVRSALGASVVDLGWTAAQGVRLKTVARRTEAGARSRLAELKIVQPIMLPAAIR